MLILETKGQDTEQDRVKRRYLDEWVQAVNQQGGFGAGGGMWRSSREMCWIFGATCHCWPTPPPQPLYTITELGRPNNHRGSEADTPNDSSTPNPFGNKRHS